MIGGEQGFVDGSQETDNTRAYRHPAISIPSKKVIALFAVGKTRLVRQYGADFSDHRKHLRESIKMLPTGAPIVHF
ncbi:hypothetical protein [Mangrovitalea sediminis]|uniref:hypothetical protein n=1 Tax=Mangrovitalea sediminis TaxID=1982043 RepID=UPI000BE5DF5A|nr:hypothetical protein [Mangrovitalea sediminis]